MIVLLDTRKADGAIGGLVAAQGASAASGTASALSLGTVGGTAAAGGGLSAAGSTSSLEGTPQPEIASMQAGNGRVNLRIKNVSDKALYQVQSATSLNDGWQTVASRVQVSAQTLVQGESGAELPAAVEVPAGDTVRFFKVIAQ